MTLLWSYVNDDESISFHVKYEGIETTVTIDPLDYGDKLFEQVGEYTVMQESNGSPMIYADEYQIDVALIVDDTRERKFVRLDFTDEVYKLGIDKIRLIAPWGNEYD